MFCNIKFDQNAFCAFDLVLVLLFEFFFFLKINEIISMLWESDFVLLWSFGQL